MKILNDREISLKTKRMAYEIAERNYAVEELYLVGINNNGYAFAELILSALPKSIRSRTKLLNVRLNPANPLSSEINVDQNLDDFFEKDIIVVDDVCNSGRTLFYAIKPFLGVVAKSIQVAVLVDRKHKSFPIHVNYMGMSLATTLQENIRVELGEEKGAFLE